jgi:predicted anti-sigma-YlaC factor YlaD
MLVCRDVTELVTDFVEGRMSFWDRLRFQLHVGMCRHCREYVRQMRTTRRVTAGLPAEPPSPEVEAELLRRFASWKSN